MLLYVVFYFSFFFLAAWRAGTAGSCVCVVYGSAIGWCTVCVCMCSLECWFFLCVCVCSAALGAVLLLCIVVSCVLLTYLHSRDI